MFSLNNSFASVSSFASSVDASATATATLLSVSMNLASKGKQLAWQAGKVHKVGYGSHFRIMTQVKSSADMFGAITLCRVNRDEVGNILVKEPVVAKFKGQEIDLNQSLRDRYLIGDIPGKEQHIVVKFSVDGDLQDKVREIFENGGEGGHIEIVFENLRLKTQEWTKTYNRTDEYDLNLNFDISDIIWYPKPLIDESRLLILEEKDLVYKKPVTPEQIKERLSESLKALIASKAAEVKTGSKSIDKHLNELQTLNVNSQEYIVLSGALMLKAQQNGNEKAIKRITEVIEVSKALTEANVIDIASELF
jgi:hypothetical protein